MAKIAEVSGKLLRLKSNDFGPKNGKLQPWQMGKNAR
jgi:hypothetical protein